MRLRQEKCVAIGLVVSCALMSGAEAAQANVGAPQADNSAAQIHVPAPPQVDEPGAPDAALRNAKVNVKVDLSTQRMHVVVPDGTVYNWPVSSGRPGLVTPAGKYHVEWMDADHVSKEYAGAPMPYAIFFNLKGDAIHGEYQRAFGMPASHGCVRLPVADAKILFAAVKSYGGANIDIFGKTRRGRVVAVAQPAQGKPPVRTAQSDRHYAVAQRGGYSYAYRGTAQNPYYSGPYQRGGYYRKPAFYPPARWFGVPIWGPAPD